MNAHHSGIVPSRNFIKGVCICKSYKIDEGVILSAIEIALKEHVAKVNLIYADRDVVHLQCDLCEADAVTPCDLFVFGSGVIVFWNFDNASISNKIIDHLSLFAVGMLSIVEVENISWEYGEEPGIDSDSGKIIIKLSTAAACKLTVSYSLSHSLKLSVFESMVDTTIGETHYLAEELATDGGISVSRKAISKAIGSLFLKKSEINLQSDILDTPDFIWDRDDLEKLYNSMTVYLDVASRISILNKRLDMISELLNILSDEQRHKHAFALETIIIVLILSEVILSIWFR